MTTTTQRLLVRIPTHGRPSAAASRRHLLAATGLDLQPLRPSGPQVGLDSAAVDRHEWHTAQLPDGSEGVNSWDAAHEALARIERAPALAAMARPDLIEPDLLQQWPCAAPHADHASAAVGDVCGFDDQDRNVPFVDGRFAWHLDDDFSQLRSARAAASAAGPAVRIAHLDTGYDPDHSGLADVRYAAGLERNFIDENRPRDARDPGVDGLLTSPGHGTGTLSILAGGRFRCTAGEYDFADVLGGAPGAEIVPVRVGNSVVQLTTGSVAKGISYVVELCAADQTRVHVISMSMGGVASAAWADAVNLAYEAGIVFVAAAGNNYSAGSFGLPTRHIVYPARFRRVLAACGAMADKSPYGGLSAGAMQGNWGPETAMTTALSAFTPNIAWASFGCNDIVRMNGAGTSSATPQIAAAAALYLQKHFAALFDPALYPQPWMRVEAVHRALFTSADKAAAGGRQEKLGNGLLRAHDALDVTPPAAHTLRKQPIDRAGFPFLNVLSRSGRAPSLIGRMLRLEATQLVQTSQRSDIPNPLEAAIYDPDRSAAAVPAQEVKRFLEAVLEHKQASAALKQRAQEVLELESRW